MCIQTSCASSEPLKTYKHEEAAGDVVSVSQDNKAKVVFESNGVYAIQCFRGRR